MFEYALKAKIPIIGVTTDDLVNVKAVLQSIAKRQPEVLPKTNTLLNDTRIYWTQDVSLITPELYRKLAAAETTAIVINGVSSPLIFDAGVLPTPKDLMADFLKEIVTEPELPQYQQILSGLSLKSASEVMQLTMARTGNRLPSEVRKTRTMIGGNPPGLYPLDIELDFYLMPKEIEEIGRAS